MLKSGGLAAAFFLGIAINKADILTDSEGAGGASEQAGNGLNPDPASTDKDGQGDARIAELSRESASYRNQRNAALRRAHALETIAIAHNLDLSGGVSDAHAGGNLGAIGGTFWSA